MPKVSASPRLAASSPAPTATATRIMDVSDLLAKTYCCVIDSATILPDHHNEIVGTVGRVIFYAWVDRFIGHFFSIWLLE